jgi:hypothetical protein
LTANAASTFTWTIGTITGGITGASAGSGSAINQTLTNPSNTTAGTVQYVVTPTSTVNSCSGAPYTITTTVNPAPAVTVSPSNPCGVLFWWHRSANGERSQHLFLESSNRSIHYHRGRW